MGTEVVLLDGGGEVLDFLRGDVGEGERLDGAGGAGLRMGDGAAILEGSREGGAGADRHGLGFEGEGGDALQKVSTSDEGGAFGWMAVVLTDLAGDRREGRPGAFRAGLGADVALEVGLHQRAEVFEQRARRLLQAVGGAGEELLRLIGAFDREVDAHGDHQSWRSWSRSPGPGGVIAATVGGGASARGGGGAGVAAPLVEARSASGGEGRSRLAAPRATSRSQARACWDSVSRAGLGWPPARSRRCARAAILALRTGGVVFGLMGRVLR